MVSIVLSFLCTKNLTNDEQKIYSKVMGKKIINFKKLICLFLCFPFFSISAFYDVSEIDPQKHIFEHLRDTKIMKGFGDGNFYPEKIVSRAEALTIAMRAGRIVIPNDFSGETYFNDVDPNAWYASIIKRGVDVGVIRINNSYFRPEQAVSKAEFLSFLFRSTVIDEKRYKNERNIAIDIPNDAWFKPYFSYAKKYQIATLPSNGFYRPNKTLTRREVARMTYRQLRIYHGTKETKIIAEIQAEIQQFLALIQEKKTTQAQVHLHKILELNNTLIRTNNNTDAVAAKAISKSMEYLVQSLRYFQYNKMLEGIEYLHLSSKFAQKASSKEGKIGEFGNELQILIEETLVDLINPVSKKFVIGMNY